MRRTHFTAALAGVLALAGADALACDMDLKKLGDISFPGRYDPFAGQQAPRTVSFRVDSKDKAGCTFGVGIDQGRNGGRRMSAGGAGHLRYDILGPGNRPVADAPATSDNGLITGRIDDQGKLDLEVYAILLPGQAVSAGSYGDQVTFSLYELSNGQPGRLLDSQTVRLEADVSTATQSTLIVGGSRGNLNGRTATLDFGVLEAGKTMSFGLEIAGNAPYQVTLESANHGYLVGTDGDTANSRIDYTLSLEGRGINLGGPFELPVASPTDFGRRSNEHTFQVRIGDTTQALAGRYGDSITVTVSAN